MGAMRALRQSIVALAIVALAALAGAGAMATAWAKDTLTIGLSQFPANFHPGIEAMVAKSYIQGATFLRINQYNANWQPECHLCVKMPTLENGLAKRVALPDGKQGIEIRFEIRPDARWGDGTPVTARDVIFGVKVGQTKDVGYAETEGYRRIRSIRADGDKAVVIVNDKVTFDYYLMPSLFVLPAHLEEPIFDRLANKADYGKETLYNRNPTLAGLWNGPYRVAEFAPGSHIALTPNAEWRGPKPNFARVTMRVIENTAALQANLLSGDIDMIAGELGITLDQGLEMAKDPRATRSHQILFQPGLVYEHIDLNLDNPILKDQRVREALLVGVDREALVQTLFEGRQPVAHTNIHPRDFGHHPNVRRYSYDPRRAGQLLDQAGWTRRGPDGVRLNAQGQRLSLMFQTTAGNKTRELVQQALQSQWREIGIETAVQNEPARVFFGETTRQRRFPALAMFAWISSPENVPRTIMHSGGIPTQENGWSGQNYTGYRNTEMDAVIEAIEGELDPAKRKALWAQYQEIYARDLPVLPLYFRADVFVLPRALKGLQPTGNQYPSTAKIHEWRWEP